MSVDDVEKQDPSILVEYGCQPTYMIVYVNYDSMNPLPS